MHGSLSQQRHFIIKWAFWGFVLLVFGVVGGVVTGPEAAHVVATIAGGIWKFLVVAGHILADSFHELQAG